MGIETELLTVVLQEQEQEQQEQQEQSHNTRQRFCVECHSNHTSVYGGYAQWYRLHKHNNDNDWLCYRCNQRVRYWKKKRALGIYHPMFRIKQFFIGIDKLLKESKQKYKRQEQKHILQQQQEQIVKVQLEGWTDRDSVDILAEILDVISRQKRFDSQKDRHNKNKMDGPSRIGELISLTAIKCIVGLSTKLLKRYFDGLRKHGFIKMITNERRNTTNTGRKKRSRMIVRQIPRITDKGFRFLQVYQQMKELLIGEEGRLT